MRRERRREGVDPPARSGLAESSPKRATPPIRLRTKSIGVGTSAAPEAPRRAPLPRGPCRSRRPRRQRREPVPADRDGPVTTRTARSRAPRRRVERDGGRGASVDRRRHASAGTTSRRPGGCSTSGHRRHAPGLGLRVPTAAERRRLTSARHAPAVESCSAWSARPAEDDLAWACADDRACRPRGARRGRASGPARRAARRRRRGAARRRRTRGSAERALARNATTASSASRPRRQTRARRRRQHAVERSAVRHGVEARAARSLASNQCITARPVDELTLAPKPPATRTARGAANDGERGSGETGSCGPRPTVTTARSPNRSAAMPHG